MKIYIKRGQFQLPNESMVGKLKGVRRFYVKNTLKLFTKIQLSKLLSTGSV